MGKLTNIIIHCSDSTFGSAAMIRKWHLENGWRDIGYHFVIPNGRITPDLFIPEFDGAVETGRELDGDGFIAAGEVGAHTLGYNDKSIGICLIGVKQFSVFQLQSLNRLLASLCRHFNIDPDNILGHYETPKAGGKTCPNFDMKPIREAIKQKLEIPGGEA